MLDCPPHVPELGANISPGRSTWRVATSRFWGDLLYRCELAARLLCVQCAELLDHLGAGGLAGLLEFAGLVADLLDPRARVRLIDRQRPEEAAFTDAVRESTREVLRTLKKKETVDLYIQQLRAKATADKALRVHALPNPDGRS